MAAKKKKKKENGIAVSKTITVKAQIKTEKKKIRKKVPKCAKKEESLKRMTDVSVCPQSAAI